MFQVPGKTQIALNSPYFGKETEPLDDALMGFMVSFQGSNQAIPTQSITFICG